MADIPAYRILLFGEYGVGKTHFKNYYCCGEFREDKIHGSGPGDQMLTKSVEKNKRKVNLQIWDPIMSRLQNINEGVSIIPLYMQGINGAIIMFDLTSKETFELTKKWHEQIKKKSSYEFPIVLVGNKSDLKSEIVVTKEEAEDMAEQIGAKYFEVSTKDGVNVKEVFDYLTLMMKPESEYKSVQIEKNNPPNNSGYCW